MSNIIPSDPRIAAIRNIANRLPIGGSLCSTVGQMVQAVLTEAQNLIAVRNTQDDMLSAKAISIRVNAAQEALKASIAKARDKTNSLVAAERKTLSDERVNKSHLAPTAYAAEIRSVFRQADSGAKLEIMGEAIANGDGDLFGALVNVPTLLTGVSAETLQQYVDLYLDKFAPLKDDYIAELVDGSTEIYNVGDRVAAA